MREQSHASELMRLVNGFQISQAIHVAAILGLADLLAAGASASDELAAKTGARPESLYRLLRVLAAAGVFHEDGERRFELAQLGAPLTSNAVSPVGPWAALIGGQAYWRAWGGLAHSVRTGETAFRHVHGASVWEHRAHNYAESRSFETAMGALSRQVGAAIVNAYDFGVFNLIVDIGGGRGEILGAILAAYPDPRGILFDQPHVVANAGPIFEAADFAGRCEVAGGDFFKAVPQGGDAYLLKAVLHDWQDEDALAILRACRAAIRPAGRLLLIEQILAPPNEGLTGKLSDLNMLVVPGGRERTREEFASLLSRTGFRLASVIPTGSAVSILQGVPV